MELLVAVRRWKEMIGKLQRSLNVNAAFALPVDLDVMMLAIKEVAYGTTCLVG